MVSDIVRQRVQAKLYLRDRVQGPAIERTPAKDCSPPNLRPSAVPRATSHLRFPFLELTPHRALLSCFITDARYVRRPRRVLSHGAERLFAGAYLDVRL